MCEPHAHKEGTQSAFVDAITNAGGESSLGKDRARRNALRRAIEGRKNDKPIWHPMEKPGERCHSRGTYISVRRDAVIGQTVPARKHHHRHIRRMKGQRRAHSLKPLVIACDMHNRALSGFPQDKLRVKALWGAGHRDM